jgi:2-keto-4-pentenoate hydratase
MRRLTKKVAGGSTGAISGGARIEIDLRTDVLDGPLQALIHFLTELHACSGAGDEQAADVVTPSAFTNDWPVSAGQRCAARFEIALPQVEVRFLGT